MGSLLNCRSILVTPAHRVDWYLRAQNSDADAIQLDLEDGVAACRKSEARNNWFNLLPAQVTKSMSLRTNPFDTCDGLMDFCTLLQASVIPDVIFLPKIEEAATVELVSRVLSDANISSRLCAILETPTGIGNAMAISKSAPRLAGLCFGMADYAAHLDVSMDWEQMMPARSILIMAAKAAGVVAIDSPTFEFSDLEQLKSDCARSRAMGFSGKIAIHPAQVPVINEYFKPDETAVLWARKVVAAAEAKRENILSMDGVMMGPPFVKRARSILLQKDGAE